jgi:hypothetical protein
MPFTKFISRVNLSKNINDAWKIFVSLIDSRKNTEHEGRNGQLSPSTSEIKNQ